MSVKYLKFLISRIAGTLVDTFLLWILSTYIFSNYFGVYIVSPTISFEAAMFFNYVVSYYWIWDKNLAVKNSKVFFSRLLVFNLSSIFAFFVKMGFLLLFERLFGWDVVYCNLLALVISGIVNFIITEWIVFKKPVKVPVANDYDDYKKQINK